MFVPVNHTDPTGHCSDYIPCGDYDESNANSMPLVGLTGSASVNAGPFASASLTVSAETLLDPKDASTTDFIVIGYSGSIGPDEGYIKWMKEFVTTPPHKKIKAPISLSGGVYIGTVKSITDPLDYSGGFEGVSKTLSTPFGTGNLGDAYVEGDEKRRALPNSQTIGLSTPGLALTSDKQKTYYIPIRQKTLESGDWLYTTNWIKFWDHDGVNHIREAYQHLRLDTGPE